MSDRQRPRDAVIAANDILRPAAEWELQSMIAKLGDTRQTIEIVGHGALRNAGRPIEADAVITTASMRGVTLYEPNELVMSARAGTPLIEIEAELASRGQMLPFEPVDIGPATGGRADHLSIGGVFATNLSGARRVATGGARDHLLGVRAVNGRGEVFKSGGRVMKNVTGLDVARGLTGSWGTLAVITEATFKVVPAPQTTMTLVFSGLPDDLAIEALTTAMGTPFEASGAAHLPKRVAARLTTPALSGANNALTLLRLEHFAASISYRRDKLAAALKIFGAPMTLASVESAQLWRELRALSIMPYSADTNLWRISTAPSNGPQIVAAIQKFMPADAFYDWSGGLVWLETPAAADAGAADVRRAVAVRGGHATLIRATPQVRGAVDVFEPMKPEIERLTRGVKEAFDPAGILNRGRMYAAM
ncbi:MAG: FAD-binding protein [Hyphomicrobium sp.]